MPPRPPTSPLLASRSRSNSFNYDQLTLTDRDHSNQQDHKTDENDRNENQQDGNGSNISYGGAGTFEIPSSPSHSSPHTSSSPIRQSFKNPIQSHRNSTSSVPAYELENVTNTSHHYPPTSSSYQRVGQNEDEEQTRVGDRNRSENQESESHKWSKLLRDAGVKNGKETEKDVHDPPPERDGFWDRLERDTKSNSLRSTIHFVRTSPYLMTLLTMIPILALLWIPGLVAVLIYHTSSKDGYSKPSVWSVGLLWWSIWLSCIYLGWSFCWLIASSGPTFLKFTIGQVSSDLKYYIGYLSKLQTFTAVFLWTLLVWLSWLLIIWNNFKDPAKYLINGDQVNPLLGSSNSSSSTSSSSDSSTSLADTGTDSLAIHMVTLGRFWLGLFLSATLLLGEKIIIQAIAWKFHLVSYADRIATSRFHIEVLTTLYSKSKSNIPGTDDVSLSIQIQDSKNHQNQPTRSGSGSGTSSSSKFNLLERKRERRTRSGGNSILADSVEDLLPKRNFKNLGFHLPKWDKNPLKSNQDDSEDSRQIVLNALDDQSTTKKLARRIFFSFATLPSSKTDPNERIQKPDFTEREIQQEKIKEELNFSESPLRLKVKDIMKFFPDFRTSESAFEMFDKDLNGDCTLEELINSCEESRLERKMLSSSMRDIDSAVGNLDGLFMSVFMTICVVIVAALISVKFSTLVASFGSALLGLSWLLSSSAQETLSSALFLFVKHPYDISDKIEVWSAATLEGTFIVQEMALLTTTFTTLTGEWTTMSHNILCTKMIVNSRRSGPTTETFHLEVSYSTSFHQIELLRSKMIEWLSGLPQRRHFLPGLDIKILTLGGTFNLNNRIGSGMNISSDQESMTISMEIRYRSNLQSQELFNKRRNLWICQLKLFLDEIQIFGLNGDPNVVKISKNTSIPYPPTLKDQYGSNNGPPDLESRKNSIQGDGNRKYGFLDDDDEKNEKDKDKNRNDEIGKGPWTPNDSWKYQSHNHSQFNQPENSNTLRDRNTISSSSSSAAGYLNFLPVAGSSNTQSQRIWAGLNHS